MSPFEAHHLHQVQLLHQPQIVQVPLQVQPPQCLLFLQRYLDFLVLPLVGERKIKWIIATWYHYLVSVKYK